MADGASESDARRTRLPMSTELAGQVTQAELPVSATVLGPHSRHWLRLLAASLGL